MVLKTKRVYEASSRTDGTRILVDRLWPRGLKKEAAELDGWIRELAPSDALRKWFAHDPAKWTEFQRRYRAELKSQSEAMAELAARAREGTLTLLFGAKDTEHNNAVALAELLEARGGRLTAKRPRKVAAAQRRRRR